MKNFDSNIKEIICKIKENPQLYEKSYQDINRLVVRTEDKNLVQLFLKLDENQNLWSKDVIKAFEEVSKILKAKFMRKSNIWKRIAASLLIGFTTMTGASTIASASNLDLGKKSNEVVYAEITEETNKDIEQFLRLYFPVQFINIKHENSKLIINSARNFMKLLCQNFKIDFKPLFVQENDFDEIKAGLNPFTFAKSIEGFIGATNGEGIENFLVSLSNIQKIIKTQEDFLILLELIKFERKTVITEITHYPGINSHKQLNNFLLVKDEEYYSSESANIHKQNVAEIISGTRVYNVYPGSLLKRVSITLSNPEFNKNKPLTIYVGNKADHNGAFKLIPGNLKIFQSDRLIILEGERDTVTEKLLEFKKKCGKALNIIYAGHGNQNSIKMGEGSGDKFYIDINDDRVFEITKEVVKSNGTIVTLSCSTGKGDNSIGQKFKEKTGITTISPGEDANVANFINENAFVTNDDGKVIHVHFLSIQGKKITRIFK
jgi:hypothetical protein